MASRLTSSISPVHIANRRATCTLCYMSDGLDWTSTNQERRGLLCSQDFVQGAQSEITSCEITSTGNPTEAGIRSRVHRDYLTGGANKFYC